LRKALLLALGVMALPAHAEPEPIINFKIQHYSVSGTTTAEISTSVFQKTPVKMNNGRFGAVTYNEFTTNYSTVGAGRGGCEVKNARIQLDSTIVLPQLVETDQSEAVIGEWGRYIGALRAHEQMHANNGKLTAETLASRLYDFKSSLPCAEMRVKLDQALDRLIQNMGEWDKQLDAQTEHGKSQGAFLRPVFK
jgi:predicted secreted Zn-dependent protease